MLAIPIYSALIWHTALIIKDFRFSRKTPFVRNNLGPKRFIDKISDPRTEYHGKFRKLN